MAVKQVWWWAAARATAAGPHCSLQSPEPYLVHESGGWVELAAGRLHAALGPVLGVAAGNNLAQAVRQAKGPRVAGRVRLWHKTHTTQNRVVDELLNVVGAVDLRKGWGRGGEERRGIGEGVISRFCISVSWAATRHGTDLRRAHGAAGSNVGLGGKVNGEGLLGREKVEPTSMSGTPRR